MEYGELIGYRDSVPYPKGVLKTGSAPRGGSMFESGNPIPWTQEMGKVVKSHVSLVWQSGRPATYPLPRSMDGSVAGEIRRFCVALKAYSDVTDNPPIEIMDLISIVDKPDSADVLKKMRAEFLVKQVWDGGYFIEPPDPLPYSLKVKPGIWQDVGDFFNPRYWFFWDQPEDEDFKWYFEPCPKPSEEDMQVFIEKVISILPDTVEAIQGDEILLEATSSTCLTPQGTDRSKHWKEKGARKPKFSKDPLRVQSSYVQKCPGDSRSAVVLSVDQSNTIKWIEKQVALMAEQVPFSAYVKDQTDFDERRRKLDNKFTYFFCRDIKKDGITKPRHLVKGVCAAIKEKYPHLPVNDYLSIYDDFYIHKDGVKMHPPRGYGLGMTCAITTIIQSAILLLVVEELQANHGVSGSIGGLFYHDDAVIAFDSDDSIADYVDIEDDVFRRYGLIMNKKKSFVCTRKWVLCERYYPFSMDVKKSYQAVGMSMPLVATNIVHAKALFRSAMSFAITIDPVPYVMSLVQHWGYEFHATEHRWPASFGGWIPAVYQGVDTSWMYTHELSPLIMASMFASCENTLTPRYRSSRNSKPYKSPLEWIHGPSLNLGGRDADYFYSESYVSMGRKMKRFLKEGSLAEAYVDLAHLRQTVFRRPLSNASCSPKVAFLLYKDSHPDVDILPPQGMFPEVEVTLYDNDESEVIPSQRYLPFLKFHNPGAPWKCSSCPIPPSIRVRGNKQMTAYERRRATYDVLTISPVLGKYFITGEWINPKCVSGALMFHYGYNHRVPFLNREAISGLGDWRNRLIKPYLESNDKELFRYLRKRVTLDTVANVNLEEFTMYILENPKEVPVVTDTAPGPPPEDPEERSFGPEEYWNWEGAGKPWFDSPLKEVFDAIDIAMTLDTLNVRGMVLQRETVHHLSIEDLVSYADDEKLMLLVIKKSKLLDYFNNDAVDVFASDGESVDEDAGGFFADFFGD